MISDIDQYRLNRALKKLTHIEQKDTLFIGEVKTIDPLSIQIINTDIILHDEFLYLGQMCKAHTVTIPHTHEYNGITENAKTSIQATSPHGACSIVDPGHTHDINKQVTEDVHKQGTDYEERVVIEIEPKLKKGDKVLLFAFNNYQKFYVAERILESRG